jgi:hypothetical protein
VRGVAASAGREALALHGVVVVVVYSPIFFFSIVAQANTPFRRAAHMSSGARARTRILSDALGFPIAEFDSVGLGFWIP